MDTVLVTGGAGYIGSHACKALAAAGYLPLTYDNLERGHRPAVKWGPLVEGDILDGERLCAVMAEFRPVAVMHFAALAYVGESVEQPALYYRNNVAGSLTLAEAAVAAGIDAFVFSSTCATYGVPAGMPITEDAPQQPINPYGRSKLMVEQMLADLPLRSVSLRYFNAAGADPDGETGEVHDPETHLIPLVLDAAAGIRPAITVFGTDYPTPDGTCVRDYVHVGDLADAHVRALRHLLDGGASAAINLGTGSGASVAQVIAAVEAVTGHPVPVVQGPRRPGDPPELVAGGARAERLLGWRPRRSALETIIADAWAWQNKGGW
jgi:UDP-glucose-4-epimerase GalE